MEKYNEYWCLSWWYIFDYLDNEAHKLAKKEIWDNVTITAEIKYMWSISEEDLQNKTIYNCTKIWNNKLLVDTDTDSKVFARFIFIIKK